MKVTDSTKAAIWQGLLDASREARYFALLAQKHRHRKYFKRILIGIAGAFASSGFFLPPEIPVTLAGVALLGSILVDLVFVEKAALLNVMSKEATSLEAEYRSLFERVNQHDDEGQLENDFARYAHERLNRRRVAIGNMTSVDLDVALNQKCTDDAYQVEQDRYAV